MLEDKSRCAIRKYENGLIIKPSGKLETKIFSEPPEVSFTSLQLLRGREELL